MRGGAGSFAARFGANLAYCRNRAGDISQEELGMRADLHRTAVGQLERGERVARSDTLVKLAGSLGVPYDELLDGLLWTPSYRTEGLMAIEPFAATADATAEETFCWAPGRNSTLSGRAEASRSAIAATSEGRRSGDEADGGGATRRAGNPTYWS